MEVLSLVVEQHLERLGMVGSSFGAREIGRRREQLHQALTLGKRELAPRVGIDDRSDVAHLVGVLREMDLSSAIKGAL